MKEQKDEMSTLSSQAAHRMLAVQAVCMPPSLSGQEIGEFFSRETAWHEGRVLQRPSKVLQEIASICLITLG